MKLYRKIIVMSLAGIVAAGAIAQVESAGGVRRRSPKEKRQQEQAQPGITDRMQDFYTVKEPHDADMQYMREIYRQLDLTKDENTPLYFPEDIIDGQKNLFRTILDLVISGKIPAYEYLDGREVFTDKYQVNIADMLDRFGIYYTTGKGHSDKNPAFVIDEADVPTTQVLNYYIIEKWEFDKRTNRMRTRVEAICPVLNRSGDFGGEAKYPMFWVKYDQIRPWLAQEYVFMSDDNNLPQYSLDDYFNLGLYKGDIYKTKNLRNLSMNQMYPDPDDLARAQDSIDNRLHNYGKHLWVPTQEEYLAQKEKAEADAAAIAKGDSIPDRTVVSADTDKKSSSANTRKRTARKTKSKAKTTKAKAPSSNGPASNAEKSVRRRRR